jgi:RNA polymerase sigma-70 factor (ECF subfamily)
MLTMNPEEQKHVITRSQAGDLDAFGQLVRTHEGWLRGWLRSQLRDWTAADDLAQDAFVTAFRKIREFRGDGSFESWLRSIANNHFRNHIRKKREEYIGGDIELQNLLETDDTSALHSAPSLEALKECLQGVAGPSRELIEARYIAGETVREISAKTNQGYSALTMKLHRLRKTLADCIETKLQTWEA